MKSYLGCQPVYCTQEDPIGLAGGMNLYGFAGGDPINFSDPFGLKQCPPDCGGGWSTLITALGGTHGIPITAPNGPPLLRVGGSVSAGIVTVGCKLGDGCGGSVNLTPQVGASIDVSLPLRSAGANEPVVGVGYGVNKHLGVSVSNEEVTGSLGVGVGSPVSVSVTAPVGPPAAPLPVPAVKPDMTAVKKKLPNQ